MKHFKYLSAALSALLIVPAIGLAQGGCSRDSLKRAVDLYIAAQTKGDTSGLAMAEGMGYMENMVSADIGKGIIKKPMKIDFHRSLYDPYTCQTFTEVIVTNTAEPYVLGTRLRLVTDKITELEIIWTTTGHWLFNADNYLQYSSKENWGEIPAGKRDTYVTLLSAANAYLDAFVDGRRDIVPWGYPCVRIEGGAYTGKGVPEDSCEIGVPNGATIVNRRYVVDETIGAIVIFCNFGAGTPGGGSGAPDTHLFRIENGKLRYAHTLTHLLQSDFRGNIAKDANYGGTAKAKKAKPQ
jgi:hypothetical protein